LFIALLLVLEAVLQVGYFYHMKSDIITSCCGTLFSESAGNLTAELTALPSYGMKVFFYLGMTLTLRTGIHFLATGKGATVFSIMAAWLMVFSLASIISFISLYYYELPTHHCPFCLIQREYHGIGYALYLFLFAGGIAGMSVGVIHRLKCGTSLEMSIDLLLSRLCLFSMSAYIAFGAIATYPILFSDFRLEGY
jgi:hypothetical protein